MKEILIRSLVSMSVVGGVSKFLANKLLATKVERDIETNFQKSIRVLFDWVFAFIFIAMILISIYITFNMKPSENVDVVEVDNENILILIISISVILATMFVYIFIGFFNRHWRRQTYIMENKDKYVILKTMNNNRILLQTEYKKQYIYRITSLDLLSDRNIYVETYNERHARRVKDFSEVYNELYKKSKWPVVICYGCITLFTIIMYIIHQDWMILLSSIMMTFGIHIYFWRCDKAYQKILNQNKQVDNETTPS